ncbi:MAG: hypothetical protein Q9223_001924 [Gallowayella weberi]
MIVFSTSSLAIAALSVLSSVDGNVIPPPASLIPSSTSIKPSASPIIARGAPGINKEGSSECFWQYAGTIPQLKASVNLIKVGTQFKAGEKIACTGFDTTGDMPDHDFGEDAAGICASLCKNTPQWVVDKSENGNQNSFGDVIGDLEWFGAQHCGTAPLVRKGNDLSKGCISVNYVTNVCEARLDHPCKGE